MNEEKTKERIIHLIDNGKTPSIQFGPLGENAHAPNECVLIDEVIGCKKALALCIIKWCG